MRGCFYDKKVLLLTAGNRRLFMRVCTMRFLTCACSSAIVPMLDKSVADPPPYIVLVQGPPKV